ncbi:kinase-like domain-containing protein [Mycena latifolia]|nr:kinase-like domain-containing protein [Mycena latifolia]
MSAHHLQAAQLAPPSQEDYEDQEINSHLWAYLVPIGSNSRVLRIDFWRLTPKYVLGRDPASSQVILPGAHISGTHAHIIWNRESGKDSVIKLQDTSSNGTWINGNALGHGKTRRLKDGDEICFGAPVAMNAAGGLYDYRYQFCDVSWMPDFGVDDFYDKGDLLGQGAYGSVYKATDRRTGTIVAIKALKYSVEHRDGAAPILVEINALERIQHPHVIKIFSAHHSVKGEPMIYLALEYMPQNLFEYMDQYCQARVRGEWPEDKGLPENTCREIMYQLCHAMSHMHALGIVHRDLKPENILLRVTNGVPFIKVADFGLAKIYKDLSRRELMTTLCGSVTYLAPEVALPPGYDHYADSFSAGVIMFTMLLLCQPWCKDRINSGAPPLPKMRWKYLTTEMLAPEGFDLLDHLVQPDPTKRVSLTGALTHRWMTAHTPMHPVSS